MTTYEQFEQTRTALAERLGDFTPKIGLVLGSGLGSYADEFSAATRIPYNELPHVPTSTVEGHSGQFVAGMVGDVPCIAMQGRLHGYEGFTAQQIVAPVRAMIGVGAKTIIVTNAAGGVEPTWQPGTLMLITDHIRMQADHPLRGPNDSRFGPRFPDMTNAYDPALRAVAKSVAKEAGISLVEGVYVAMDGPAYETPAEVQFIARMGGHAAGMSTVPEVIAARHMGARVLGFSCITNQAAGISGEALHHDEVTEVAARVRGTFKTLLSGVIDAID